MIKHYYYTVMIRPADTAVPVYTIGNLLLCEDSWQETYDHLQRLILYDEEHEIEQELC